MSTTKPSSSTNFPAAPHTEALCNRLAEEISGQEALHASLLKDLSRLAASPSVSEEDFHATFLKALGRSGLETRLQNAVFHLLRTRRLESCLNGAANNEVRKQEPLAYLVKIQHQWERRIMKSLNSMSSDLGLCLAKPRCQDEQDELMAKWNELSTLDVDLSLFRPVYAPKDFLEIITQISSPNLIDTAPYNNGENIDTSGAGESPLKSTPNSTKPSWGLIAIPLSVPTLDQLREKFIEIARCEPHLGFNPQAPSLDDPSITLEAERYNLGQKVIMANHAPLSQEFLKRGAPHSLRGKLWAQVLGSDSATTAKERENFEELREAVIRNDVMIDKLILKDVQLTAANDDNYFVFEDVLLQVSLCFSRDTEVLKSFKSSCSKPARAVLRGKLASADTTVSYPPSGVVPFHGFSMYCAPFCYVYSDPCQLYYTFRAFYLQFCCKLHEVSSDRQGILALCALFENIMQVDEPDLWNHLLGNGIQPLRLVFRWIMRGFSGHLPPDQLLFLWDLVLAYDSMEIFPLLAATILSFRKDNLLLVDNLQGVEAVLADLSSLPVVPLLQLSLEWGRGN